MPRPAGFEKPIEGSYSHKEELEPCDSGFLTKAQQDILDAAVLEKQKSGKYLSLIPQLHSNILGWYLSTKYTGHTCPGYPPPPPLLFP
jgi:hypothetical protein